MKSLSGRKILDGFILLILNSIDYGVQKIL